MRRQAAVLGLSALACGMTSIPAMAGQDYVFTNIIDSTDPDFGSMIAGPMNDAGQVAFYAYAAGSNTAGIYLFDGTDIHLVEPLAASNTYAHWGIDGNGNVYYSRVFTGSSDGVYMCTVGNPTVAIFDNVVPNLDTVDQVFVNEDGDVTFTIYYDNGNTVAYEGRGDTPPNTVTVLADAFAGGFDFVGKPYIRDDGECLLITQFFDVPQDDYRLQTANANTPPNTLTTQVDAFGEFSSFYFPRFNADGVMFFGARRDVYGTDQHLYLGTSTNLLKLFQGSDPFWTGNFGPMDINDHGEIAFTAQLEGQIFEQRGVYDGWTDPVENLVVGDGTPLFGDTCIYAINNVGSINQSGQIAFWYRLSNGVEGMAIATPVHCQWDLNFDGTVNTADLLLLLAQWGPCGGQCPGDFDESGAVDTADLLALLANWDDCDIPTRACCFGDGTCDMLTVTDCFLNDGTPLDSGTFCQGDADGNFVDDACDGVIPTQACCFDNGDCLDLHPDGCLGLGGTAAGPGSACAGDNDGNGIDDECEAFVDTLACCVDASTCIELTEEDCLNMGHTPLFPGSNCFNPDLCILTIPGGCCVDGNCVMTDDSDDCDALGGIFQGHDTDCINITCDELGACCAFGKCVDSVDEETCVKKFGGDFQGPGTFCEKDDCIVGACCVDGECLDNIIEIDCEKELGGVYMGDYTYCEKEVCP